MDPLGILSLCEAENLKKERGVQGVKYPPLEAIKKGLVRVLMKYWLAYVVHAKNLTMLVNNVFIL